MWLMTFSIHSVVGIGASIEMSWRLMRRITGPPTFIWMSEAPPSTAAFKIRWKISMRPD